MTRAAWGILIAIVALIAIPAAMLLDRRPPITDVSRDFLGWAGPRAFIVDYAGIRHRRCDAIVRRVLLNGSGRNTHRVEYAPYEVDTGQQAALGAFASPPRVIDLPPGIDLSEPVTLTLEVDYACNVLQRLWRIPVEFPPLPLPLPPGQAP